MRELRVGNVKKNHMRMCRRLLDSKFGGDILRLLEENRTDGDTKLTCF